MKECILKKKKENAFWNLSELRLSKEINLFQGNWIPTYLLNSKKVDGFHISQSLTKTVPILSAMVKRKKRFANKRHFNYDLKSKKAKNDNKAFIFKPKLQIECTCQPWWIHLLQHYIFHQIYNSALSPQRKGPSAHPCVLSESIETERVWRIRHH